VIFQCQERDPPSRLGNARGIGVGMGLVANYNNIIEEMFQTVLRSRSRIFWSEPEPQRDAAPAPTAPAPTMVLHIVRN
jgi:hypothetical protein